MSTPNNTPRQNMDDLLNEIRNERIEPAVVEQAASRVWARVAQEVSGADPVTHKIRGCADFQAMLPAWRDGSLPASRRVLLEDHIHECVACRHAAEAGKVIQFPKLGQAPVVRHSIWQIPVMRYAVAASLFLLLGIGSWNVLRSIISLGPRFFGSRATVQTVDGQLFRLSGAGLVAVKAGEELPAGAEIRTARNSHAVVRLKDGSLVEMRERSAFAVTESPNDLNVELARGAVIVQAAKRSAGHLYVTTRDCRVAVTGTVFSVDSGVKGSRVAVMEGEVHVNQDNNDTVLHPGDQKATDPSMEPLSIREQISWSQNVDRHMALLQELAAMQKALSQIPQPGMRYSSQVLNRLPNGTIFYMAIPNIGQQLGQVQQVMGQRVQESPVLKEWWSHVDSNAITEVIDTIRNFSDYVGDEVVIAAVVTPEANGKMNFHAPVLMAQVKRGGLAEFAKSEFTRLAKGGKSHVQIVEDPSKAAADQSNDILMSVQNDVVMMTPEAATMRILAAGPHATQDPFLSRLQQVYQDGVGFLFAADLGSMTAAIATHSQGGGVAPLGNVRYLIVQQRDMGANTDTQAVMTFNGPRQGIFGWLARPSPMAALDFVTAQAAAVTSFAIANPGQVIDDLLSWAAANNTSFPSDLAKMEAELGFSIRNDLAASLGSEFVLALDGPVLPVPSWKIVTEVYDPQKLQWVFTKMTDAANAEIAKKGGSPLQSTQQVVGNLIYYRIVYPDAQPVAEIDYVFTGGYLIMAPSRTLLDAAIQAKATGNTLPRSASFRNALPHDRQDNFSALVYQNFGTSINSFMQVWGNKMDAQTRQKLLASASDGQASLIGAYGENDRIVVASSSLMGIGSGTLMNMAGPLSLLHMFGDREQHGTKHR